MLTALSAVTLAAVLVAGTLVTAAGPHAGDTSPNRTVPRLRIEITALVHAHASLLVAYLALLVGLDPADGEWAARILKLNIGNPAPFGFEAPDANHGGHDPAPAQRPGLQRFARHLLRTRFVQYYQTRGLHNIDVDDVYLGNGVSQLITLSLMALLGGDEVAVPTPDYPLWTASVSLAGGRPVHYLCWRTAGGRIWRIWRPRSRPTPRAWS